MQEILEIAVREAFDSAARAGVERPVGIVEIEPIESEGSIHYPRYSIRINDEHSRAHENFLGRTLEAIAFGVGKPIAIVLKF